MIGNRGFQTNDFPGIIDAHPEPRLTRCAYFQNESLPGAVPQFKNSLPGFDFDARSLNPGIRLDRLKIRLRNAQ